MGPVGATGPVGPQGLQGDPGVAGLTGPQGPAGANAAKYLVDTSLAFGATHTSIQAAINQAVADGHGPTNPTTIQVRPGTYVGNLTLVAGVHLTAVVAGKSFATKIDGTVAHSSGVVSMIGIDIEATSGGDAITITGTLPFTQLYISDCIAYAYNTNSAAVLDVTTDGSSGIIFNNVNFRVLGGSGVPINLLRGTIQGRAGTFWPVAQTTPALAITGAGGPFTKGRAWLRDCDLFGKVTVSGNGELQLLGGQVRSGNGPAVEDTSSGPITMSNLSVQSSLAVGDVVTSDGNLFYSNVGFLNALQTMPVLAARLPGTDALSAEAFCGYLTNDVDFTGSMSATPANMVFGNVQQNTASNVFVPQVDGSIVIQRAGTVSVAAGVAVGTTGFADFQIEINGVARASGTVVGTGKLAANLHWKVAVGDSIRVRAVPSQISGISSNGFDKTLSIQWTGVR